MKFSNMDFMKYFRGEFSRERLVYGDGTAQQIHLAGPEIPHRLMTMNQQTRII